MLCDVQAKVLTQHRPHATVLDDRVCGSHSDYQHSGRNPFSMKSFRTANAVVKKGWAGRLAKGCAPFVKQLRWHLAKENQPTRG